MFTKELSAKLIKIIDEREITIETLAEIIGLTRESVTNIKNGKQIPSVSSLEKMCSALHLEPNDLLLNEKSLQKDRSKPKQVTIIYCKKEKNTDTYTPVCPTCNSLLNSNWESYCSYCGQRLSWERYIDSFVTYEKPKRKQV